ncbi:transglutaminase family protein [Mangrovimonas sp. YM274]|uniref:transglutaminase-like domain-containing protein n=1 Tax=Mangrovimonas sp. YM274 TaxID=3070660 RepID=UPI0027DAB975|nr:transglutaminase-like domain-containing protein [Mangrovimonas sp. YM274]WMI67708.1 transglutaminase-like domain-containing protein [Mangrovimonas sp. YM274]
MKNKLLPLLGLVTLLGYSQKKFDPTPEHITQAKELNEQFPEEDVILLNTKDYVKFDIDKRNTLVTVDHSQEQQMMNISNRADIQKYDFYNGEIEIEDFYFSHRNKDYASIRNYRESYTSNDLFHNDSKVIYANVDFPVQGYQYFFQEKKHYKDIKYFTSIHFTDEYRILEKEVEIRIPQWLEIEFKEMNFEGFDITKKESKDEKTGDIIITYSVKNLEARYDEQMMPGPSYIYPHILVLSKSFTYDDKKHKLFGETADLYAWYSSLINQMKDNPAEFKSKVADLTANAKSDEEKIKNIYYWVQDNIRYIAFEDGIAGFKPDDSQNVFKKRYGDCKGMANLIKQMLVEAGFDVRLTWIGTKHIAYDYSTPSLSVDNHMICTLFKDGKKIFLDGTEKYNSFGEYAERIQGKQALIEDGDNFILEPVPVSTAATNASSFVYNAKIVDEEITGTAKRTFKGESRASFLYHYHNLMNDKKEEALTYYLDDGDKNIKVENIVTSDLENREADMAIDYSLTLKNAISSFDGTIYLDLDPNKEFSSYELEDRKIDLMFQYKTHYQFQMNLEIPKGYAIDNLPEAIDIDNEDFRIKVELQLQDNKLEYNKLFVIKNAQIKQRNFQLWNNTIKQLKKIYNEQLLLTKPNNN